MKNKELETDEYYRNIKALSDELNTPRGVMERLSDIEMEIELLKMERRRLNKKGIT